MQGSIRRSLYSIFGDTIESDEEKSTSNFQSLSLTFNDIYIEDKNLCMCLKEARVIYTGNYLVAAASQALLLRLNIV